MLMLPGMGSQIITKAGGARLEFSLALAIVAVKVDISQEGGRGRGLHCDSFTAKHTFDVILSQESRFGGGGGGGVQCDSFCERLGKNNVMFGW